MHRQAEVKGGADSDGALEPYLPTMLFHQVFGDRQTEARAFCRELRR